MTNTIYKEVYDRHVKWNSTKLKGLTGVPTLSGDWDTRDWISELPFNWLLPIQDGNGQFSKNNKDTLVELIKSKPDANMFVEIGTASSWEGSSTEAFITNKCDNTIFVTIDIQKRSENTLGKPNVVYLVSKSTDNNIKNFLKGEKIDILFIDGDHSVKTVFEEYEFYLPLMKEDGVIVLHDTTMHPGPYLFMEAVDSNVFRKQKLYSEDFGLGLVYLK